jgi:hypothetical protein
VKTLNRFRRRYLSFICQPIISCLFSSSRRVGIVALAVALTFVIGCGKRRPPQPPVERVQQRTELLSGVQQGNQVVLSWPAPSRNAPDSSVQSIRRVDVYRLAEKPGAPLPLTEDEFSARSTLVGSVTFEEIRNAGENLTYTDKLELNSPTRLRYAVRYVNASGQRAAFSNFLLIEPAARIAQPPSLASTDLTESAINLSWQPPTANIDGSTPPNLLGYNIYRLDESQNEPGQTPINSAPVTATTYSDKNFKFGNSYRYVVRSVSLGTEGLQVESLNSNVKAVTAKDTFAPSKPAPPGIAPDPRGLAIFFAPNSEADVAGYNIFRSTDPNLPKTQWTKLNQALLVRPNFLDERVEKGRRYYYYVVAIDTAGNISEPSEVGSETMQ